MMEYRIRYEHVQLLMNQYRFGAAQRIDWNRLSYTSRVGYGATSIRTKIWASIVRDELLIHVNSKMRLSCPSDIVLIRREVPEICPHLTGLYQGENGSQGILCRPCHAIEPLCADCRKQRRCQECVTWYQISASTVGVSGREIQIDIWKYLGRCETPLDPMWANQIGP